MSTASQRRKARRLALQAPFVDKVREVALSLPRRRPEPANGMQYVERIEAGPGSEGLGHRFRIVDLSEATGGKPHRRFFIPYGEPELVRLRNWADMPEMSPPPRHLEFIWRAWAVRAGDTEVRWFTPELVGERATEDGARAFYAARKACAYVAKSIGALEFFGHRWLEEDMRQAYEALQEFIGVLDPDATRAEREAVTNEEARAAAHP